MIAADQFLAAAIKRGYIWYSGVPCSFLTPFINNVINNRDLTYIASANEGDAVSVAAGVTLGGGRAVAMMQNSGLGNAVSPITSLTHVFRIPVLLVVTWRGMPGRKDEPQHELMGEITTSMLDTMRVPWEFFPDSSEAIDPVLDRANRYMECEQRPYALILRKGAVAPGGAPVALDGLQKARSDAVLQFTVRQSDAPTRTQALDRILGLTPVQGSVVIATTGYTGRELYALCDRANQLYVVGSMGCASSLALGLSMARPDLRVTVIDGDGAALMRLGTFATIGAYGGSNLVHVVLDNGVHDSTGGQATVSPGLSFAKVAQACGYGLTLEGDDLALLDALYTEDSAAGARFGVLKIKPGAPAGLPRPAVTPVQVRERFMSHIGTVAFTAWAVTG